MLDPQLHASITVAAETALAKEQASAERWTRGQALGRLDGIPLALKNNMDLAGLLCTAGRQVLAKCGRPRRAWAGPGSVAGCVVGVSER